LSALSYCSFDARWLECVYTTTNPFTMIKNDRELEVTPEHIRQFHRQAAQIRKTQTRELSPVGGRVPG